jgi:acetyltransferase-like isoleucine patch superfamily enzyme
VKEKDLFARDERADMLRPAVLGQFITNLMTDSERAAFYGLLPGCRMRENAKIYSSEKFVCGDHVWIGEDAKIDASGGLEIGSYTSIGLGVFIWSHNSVLSNLLKDNRPGSRLIKRNPTRIGEGCFIAGPTVIMPGVTIGDCVVVAPMSVVTKDVPSFTVAAGNPSRQVRKVDPKYISELLDDLVMTEEERATYLTEFTARFERATGETT